MNRKIRSLFVFDFFFLVLLSFFSFPTSINKCAESFSVFRVHLCICSPGRFDEDGRLL